MTPNDRKQFIEVVLAFAELKGKQLSAPALELYWRAMRDWPLDEFLAAAEYLIRTCEWMPTPKHFEDLRKAAEPGPAEAWTAALAACVHWRNPKQLPTGVIARAAAAVGGFRAIAMSNPERDLPHVQRRFQEAYDELRGNEHVRDSVPAIADANRHAARIATNRPLSLDECIPKALANASAAKARP